MLFGFLVTLYTINCVLLVLIIMIQQGKGGLGIGALGGSSQMLFGGSGGQDLFQKVSWVLGAIYMFGSLGLSLLRTHQYRTSAYVRTPRHIEQSAPIQQAPIQLPEPVDVETE